MTRGALEDGLLDLTEVEQDAISIAGWLQWRHFRPTPIVPASAVDGLRFAHENTEAWLLVDVPDGLTVAAARRLMAAAA